MKDRSTRWLVGRAFTQWRWWFCWI